MNRFEPGLRSVLLLGWLLWGLFITVEGAVACTTIMVGRGASADGSVLMATSCDGNIMGRIYVQPEKEYPAGTAVPMLYDFPAPSTWKKYQEGLRKENPAVGHLPM